MARKRPGFMVYFDDVAALGGLDDAQFGELLRGMVAYAQTGKDPAFDNPVLMMAFSMLRCKLDMDAARYEKRVKAGQDGANRRWNGGRTGGECDSRQGMARDSNEWQGMGRIPTTTTPSPSPSITSSAINDNTDQPEARPPTMLEVGDFFRERGLHADAAMCYQQLVSQHFNDGDGRPIRNWHRYVIAWAKANPGKTAGAMNYAQREYKSGELDHIYLTFDEMVKAAGGGEGG